MTTQRFVNNFSTRVAATLGAADTYLHVVSAAGLPTLQADEYMLLTLFHKSGVEESGHEVVRVTSIVENQLTVVRAEEGTTASQFLSGDYVEARMTAGGASNMVQQNDPRLSNARPASDVATWAKAATKPSYTAAEVGAHPTLVSGENIKTVNSQNILGSGDIQIPTGINLAQAHAIALYF